MSLDVRESGSFLGPLKGRTNTLVVDTRQSNLLLARAIVHATDTTCLILDVDALYSSNADSIFSGLDPRKLKGIKVRVPELGSEMGSEISTLLASEAQLIVIDSINSLNHLLSEASRVTRGRKLSFAVAALSHAANQNGQTILFSMYQRERGVLAIGGSRLGELSETTISVRRWGERLRLKCERGTAWDGGVLNITSGIGGRYQSTTRRP